jgi:hypothetical protein
MASTGTYGWGWCAGKASNTRLAGLTVSEDTFRNGTLTQSDRDVGDNQSGVGKALYSMVRIVLGIALVSGMANAGTCVEGHWTKTTATQYLDKSSVNIDPDCYKQVMTVLRTYHHPVKIQVLIRLLDYKVQPDSNCDVHGTLGAPDANALGTFAQWTNVVGGQ